MRFTGAVLLASAGIAAAQSTTSTAAGSSSTCLAENIVQACLASTGTQVSACASTDYSCLCSAYTNQLTCYNNCPSDEGRYTVQSQVTAWCAAASGQSSMSAATATTKSSSATASGSSTADTSSITTTSSSSTSATVSAASTSSTSSGMANPMAIPAGSMLAMGLGLLGML